MALNCACMSTWACAQENGTQMCVHASPTHTHRDPGNIMIICLFFSIFGLGSRRSGFASPTLKTMPFMNIVLSGGMRPHASALIALLFCARTRAEAWGHLCRGFWRHATACVSINVPTVLCKDSHRQVRKSVPMPVVACSHKHWHCLGYASPRKSGTSPSNKHREIYSDACGRRQPQASAEFVLHTFCSGR